MGVPTLIDDTAFPRAQAATYIGMAEQTLAAWAVSGRQSLPFFKVGRKVYYKKSDLDRWLAERPVLCGGKSDEQQLS
jgi:excisionase family DNA binding protein